MSAPNLINATTITGKTAVLVSPTSATALLTNSSGSGKAQKVNGLIISNTTGSISYLTVDVYRSSVAYPIIYNIGIPASTSLDVLNKVLYLEEGDTLRVASTVNNALTAVCSYEEIS
jgi:hypothetical protein